MGEIQTTRKSKIKERRIVEKYREERNENKWEEFKLDKEETETMEGIQRKVDSAMELLTEAGFPADQTKVEWLFGNSKNERTIFAIKRNNK